MLSSPRNPPAKRCLPCKSLRFTHQVKFISSFWKAAERKRHWGSLGRTGVLVDFPAGPGVHRRIHVAEVEFVGRQLPVGMHVPLAQKEAQLVPGEHRIEPREGDHVERQVPGREPGIFPLVGHRQHVAAEEVPPVGVPARLPLLGRRRHVRIALQPILDDVAVELLAPQQSGIGAAGDAAIVALEVRQDGRIELVGLGSGGRRTDLRRKRRRRPPAGPGSRHTSAAARVTAPPAGICSA